MARKDLGHGARLSDEDYEKSIVQLYRGLPPLPSKEQEREVRRRELDLAIDHRLGRDFPRARRDALWAVQQRVEKKRLRLALRHLLRRWLPSVLVKGAQDLAGYMVDEYARVLDKDELESFFRLKPGQRPMLPVDVDQVRKK
jgi:hypothetical protein